MARESGWTARGGASEVAEGAEGAGVAFIEDVEHGLHGLVKLVNSPSSAGLGVRLRIRRAQRRHLAVWVRRIGIEETLQFFVDLERGTVTSPPDRGDGAYAEAIISPLGPRLYDLWLAVREPTHKEGYRIDVLARLDADGSSQFQGDGQRALVLESFELADPEIGQFQLFARQHGYEAVAHFASVRDYYSEFFTEEKLRAALGKVSAAEGTAVLFDAFLNESAPPATLSLNDLSARWLAAGSADALRFEGAAETLLNELGEGGDLQRALAEAKSVRAAVEFAFASDAGARPLQRAIEAEHTYVSAPGLAPRHLAALSPRLTVAALMAAAGLHGAGRYLAHLDVRQFCFDQFVLTRPYLETAGRSMARVGRVHLSLRAGARK